MVQINFAKKEVNCKIVYYGPGMSGKTTNLEIIHKKVPSQNKGDLTSIATEGERTLFFDFLPLDLGTVSGMSTKFQIYTVPGQIYYSSTRRLVLQGVDGLVFVADSQKQKLAENIESLQDLKDNLKTYDIDINNIPLLIQYNKRDLPDIMDIDDLEKKINTMQAPFTEAVAITGEGVIKSLKILAKLTLDLLNKKATSQKTRPVETVTQAQESTKKESDTPVCEIEGEAISENRFNDFCLIQIKLSSKRTKELHTLTEQERKNYLNLFINHFLILNESKKQGFQATQEEKESQINKFASRIGSHGKLKEYLQQRGLTIEQLHTESTKNILTSKLLKFYFPDLKEQLSVNLNEISDYYNTHKDQYDVILDECQDKIVKLLKKNKKKSLLDTLYSRLREGKSITRH